MRLPVISLMSLARGDAASLQQLIQACESIGFFYLSDLGISQQTLQQAAYASRQFFGLPTTVKSQFGHDAQTVFPRAARGYVALHGETLHPSAGPDPKECFDLGVEADRVLTNIPFNGQTKMPSNELAPGFAQSLYGLQGTVMDSIVPTLVQAFSRALGYAADALDSSFSSPTLCQRVLYYPGQNSSAGKHTDNGVFTVLLLEPGDQEALSVYSRKTQTWIDVPAKDDCCVINLGDMLQMMSGDRFVSTPHEVAVRHDGDRVSFAFFIYPNIDATVSAEGPQGSGPLVRDIMLANFESIWVTGGGAGRAAELV